ncbi:hypothetical protein BC940DRAFT_314191, partial [Gongronella butleri]
MSKARRRKSSRPSLSVYSAPSKLEGSSRASLAPPVMLPRVQPLIVHNSPNASYYATAAASSRGPPLPMVSALPTRPVASIMPGFRIPFTIAAGQALQYGPPMETCLERDAFLLYHKENYALCLYDWCHHNYQFQPKNINQALHVHWYTMAPENKQFYLQAARSMYTY